jgi:cytoskeletal protein RodZ
MNPVGDLLRRAREEQGRTLDDIATATRIHRRFLEQLEQGALSSLPQPYLRAFIRDYALEVNVDPAEALRQYESAIVTQEDPAPRGTSGIPPAQVGIRRSAAGRAPPESQGFKNKQGKVLLIFTVLLLLGLAVSLYWLHERRSAEPVHEIVFQDMVKEWEEKNAKPLAQNAQADSASHADAKDSLTLVGVAIDTVWIRYVVDNAAPHELLLRPKQEMHLKGKEKFLVSLGNAGGISFAFNGTSLGTLGKKGKPMGSVLINRETATHLRKP